MAVSPRLCLAPILDTNGLPITGARVNVYAAGTTTPLSLYTDSALSVAAANPIVATAGFVPLRFMATASYKLVVTTSASVSITGYDGDNIDPGVAVGAGALPIANGGTAATTAAAARTNLAAAAATDMATAQSDISNIDTWAGYLLTTRSRIASGTTAQQPAAANNSLRGDTTTARLLWDNATAWRNVLTAGDWTAADMMTGGVVQVVNATPYVANADIISVIATDDSKPQISEGVEILTATVTPKHASSTMLIFASLPNASGTAGATQITAGIFKTGTADCLVANGIQNTTATNQMGFPAMFCTNAPGSVSPVTYSVRVGSSGGTIRFNGTTVGRLYGGAASCQMTIVEVRG